MVFSFLSLIWPFMICFIVLKRKMKKKNETNAFKYSCSVFLEDVGVIRCTSNVIIPIKQLWLCVSIFHSPISLFLHDEILMFTCKNFKHNAQFFATIDTNYKYNHGHLKLLLSVATLGNFVRVFLNKHKLHNLIKRKFYILITTTIKKIHKYIKFTIVFYEFSYFEIFA